MADTEQPVFNSALVVQDGEVLGRYDKRHLVPWGEYVPLGDLLPFVGYLARSAGAFSAGDEPTLLPFSGERIGTAICFEVIFPAAVAEQVRAGASLLVTITNDAWYGDTFAPWQHLRAAQFRAAESARPMLRAAITGISAWIDAQGGLRQTLGIGEEGILRVEVRGRSGLTLYSRLPWLVPFGCVGLLGVLWLRARRRLAAPSEVRRLS
jgi:apolipoprotein N-acyltransferase